MKTMSPVLEIQGLSDLEVAELKQEFRAQGVDLDEIAKIDRPAMGDTKVGEPSTVILLFELGKIVLPVLAAALASWLAKGRARSRNKSFIFTMEKGKVMLQYSTTDNLIEQESPKDIQEKLLELAKGAE